jgi:hypothetical protein
MADLPLAVGLLACDLVIVDDRTRGVTPVNCFSKRAVRGPFPTSFTFYLVAALTNGNGRWRQRQF